MAEPQREEVELKLGGRKFGGWKDIDVSLDLDSGASTFKLGVTKRDPERNEDWTIQADEPCEVLIGGETVITGYTDRIESDLSAEAHSIAVSGRSKAADLVDCSAVATPGSWQGKTIGAIAAELAKPFDVAVKVEGDQGAPLRKFSIQQGETVWEAITRMAQHRALLPISRADGSVALITAKPEGAAVRLVEGSNLKTIRGHHDVSERFSQYIVKGQSAGDDELNGKAAAQPKAESADPAVRRYRPLIVVAEEQADAATLKKRAQWEATVRAARAQEATAELVGWRRDDGQLWAFLHKVDLDAPSVFISDTLMVAGVRFVVDDQGRRVELRLVRPESYSQLAVPEEAESSRIKRKDRKSRRERERERDEKKGKAA